MDERKGAGWYGYVAGETPVQGCGRVDGLAWYFRARGAAWSMEIVDHKDIDPEALPVVGELSGWVIEEDDGTWPEAGYMKSTTAWPLIKECFEKFRAGQLPYIVADSGP